jgi:hypothetical protein
LAEVGDAEADAIAAVFQGDQNGVVLFGLLRDVVESFGPVHLRIARTQVAFAGRRQFAWVWRPNRWTKNRPEHSVVLSFGLEERIVDRRIVEAVETAPGRWMHHVILLVPADLDDIVRGWLRRAYDEARPR